MWGEGGWTEGGHREGSTTDGIDSLNDLTEVLQNDPVTEELHHLHIGSAQGRSPNNL